MASVFKRIFPAVLTILVVGAFISGAARAAVIDELNADQQRQILSGQQVILTQKVDGKPWPKMYVYEFVPSTPEEAEAVTMDYGRRASYTADEGCKYSRVAKVVDPSTMQVDYIVSVPVLGDEHFTLENHVAAYNNGAAYSLQFHLVRADRTKESDGLTRFEAWNGGTIMAVYSFVDPGVPLAGMVKGRAVKQTAGAADDFVKQVIYEKQSDQPLLQSQLAALRQALGTQPQ